MTEIYYRTVPKLQNIAASTVAVALWKHIDILYVTWQTYPNYCMWSSSLSHVLELTELLSSPKRITELIKSYVRKVSREMTKWTYYNYAKISVSRYYLYLNFSLIVWHPNCTVNTEETARNLQKSNFLNELEKFRFLCFNCLRVDIEQKWKMFENSTVFNSISFDDDPLTYYWSRHCRNRLQDIPVTQGVSIDEFMCKHSKVNNWTARVFFFDRLTVDKQIECADWIIAQFGLTYQKFVLWKLNRFQRGVLYATRWEEILTNYAKNQAYYDDVLPTWLEIAEIITKDQFVVLLHDLSRMRVERSIFGEIWINATNTFKLHALNVIDIIDDVWNAWMLFYNYDLFKMLLDTSTNIREKIKRMPIFCRHCKGLLERYEFAKLGKVLNLCFPIIEELGAVKRILALSQRFLSICKDLTMGCQGDFSKLVEFMDLFYDVVFLEDVLLLVKSPIDRKFLQARYESLMVKYAISEFQVEYSDASDDDNSSA